MRLYEFDGLLGDMPSVEELKAAIQGLREFSEFTDKVFAEYMNYIEQIT